MRPGARRAPTGAAGLATGAVEAADRRLRRACLDRFRRFAGFADERRQQGGNRGAREPLPVGHGTLSLDEAAPDAVLADRVPLTKRHLQAFTANRAHGAQSQRVLCLGPRGRHHSGDREPLVRIGGRSRAPR
jgi:hypothetical protein